MKLFWNFLQLRRRIGRRGVRLDFAEPASGQSEDYAKSGTSSRNEISCNEIAFIMAADEIVATGESPAQSGRAEAWKRTEEHLSARLYCPMS